MVHQHVDHGRHELRVRDLLHLDGLQDLDGLEARHEGVAAARHRDAEGRGAIGQVEHRPGMEVGGVCGKAHAGHAVQRIHDQIGVGEHHALGTAGRSAGIEEAGQVVVPGAGIVDRFVVR